MGLLSFIFNAKKYKKNDEVCSQSSEKILKNGLFGREIYWFDVVSYLKQGGVSLFVMIREIHWLINIRCLQQF